MKMLQTQSRSVTPVYGTLTRRVIDVPGMKKQIVQLNGYRPSLADKPVQIKVEYSRPKHITATLSNAGYQPAFDRLKGELLTELGSTVRITGAPGATASFEIYADGKLLHSKLGGSPGALDTDGVPLWTKAERKVLVGKLKPLVANRMPQLSAGASFGLGARSIARPMTVP